jgi:hypothetical protein
MWEPQWSNFQKNVRATVVKFPEKFGSHSGQISRKIWEPQRSNFQKNLGATVVKFPGDQMFDHWVKVAAR